MNCKNCGESATINVQKVWIDWEYNPETGECSKKPNLLLDVEEPTGNENLYLCSKCFYEWKNGRLRV